MYLIACYVRLAHQFLTLLWCASHLAQPFIIPIPVDSRILTLVCNFFGGTGTRGWKGTVNIAVNIQDPGRGREEGHIIVGTLLVPPPPPLASGPHCCCCPCESLTS